MNIREIETELGIPRASVRYYEKEGLLSPQRGENNYRVYTQADVETLKKIRLLRQLSMPVETIRAVQEGAVPLSDALDRQRALLEGEAEKLDLARQLCADLLKDQVTYPALDPARYQKPALPWASQIPPAIPEDDPLPEGAVHAFSPWQRFWARGFDFGLVDFFWCALLALVFHFSPVTNSGVNFFSTLLTMLTVLFLEPLLLSTWGTTPGKWLLGLTLRDMDGDKLSYSDSLERTWGVLGTGCGFCIPIYTLYRHYKCYKICQENESLPYDRDWNNRYYSRVGDRWYLRAVLSIALLLALVPIQLWTDYQVLVPPNRGAVTSEEFAENVNYLSRQLNYGLLIDGQGRELWTGSDCYISEDGGPQVYMEHGKPVSDQPLYTLETDENGFVTAVCLAQSGTGDDQWTMLPAKELQLTTMALLGTSCSGRQLASAPLMDAMGSESMEDLFRDGSLEIRYGQYALTLALEQNGYRNGASFFGYMIPAEDTPPEDLFYRFTTRLERVD